MTAILSEQITGPAELAASANFWASSVFASDYDRLKKRLNHHLSLKTKLYEDSFDPDLSLEEWCNHRDKLHKWYDESTRLQMLLLGASQGVNIDNMSTDDFFKRFGPLLLTFWTNTNTGFDVLQLNWGKVNIDMIRNQAFDLVSTQAKWLRDRCTEAIETQAEFPVLLGENSISPVLVTNVGEALRLIQLAHNHVTVKVFIEAVRTANHNLSHPMRKRIDALIAHTKLNLGSIKALEESISRGKTLWADF